MRSITDRRATGRRILWFVGLYAASVAVVTAVAFALRAVLVP